MQGCIESESPREKIEIIVCYVEKGQLIQGRVGRYRVDEVVKRSMVPRYSEKKQPCV